jgi:ribonuclease VapC
MAEKAILDASALLALLQNETGADLVRRVYDRALVSAVNLAEVASAMVEKGRALESVRRDLSALPLEVVPFEGDQIFEAARLRRLTHHEKLSLADRACLALARMRGLPVYTTDRAWRSLKLGVDVRVVR